MLQQQQAQANEQQARQQQAILQGAMRGANDGARAARLAATGGIRP